MPNPLLQCFVLIVQHVRTGRAQLAQQKKIAVFDLFGADYAEPLAPLCGNLEPDVRQHSQMRHDFTPRNITFEFDTESNEGVFVAIIDRIQ